MSIFLFLFIVLCSLLVAHITAHSCVLDGWRAVPDIFLSMPSVQHRGREFTKTAPPIGLFAGFRFDRIRLLDI